MDFLGPSFFFWSVGAFFGVEIRFKNIFGTYLCSQSTLVLEVQPYIFAFTSAKFGGIFALFGPLGFFFCSFLDPLGLFLESGSGSKTFLEPTYVVNQLWFWKYSLIFLFLIRLNLGPFALFGPFRAIFVVWVRFKNFFGTYLCRQSTLVLEIQPYLFVFNSAKLGPFCTFWASRGYF